MAGDLNHIDELENRSVHILREAYANFKNLGMLWSIGKDSTVLLWLARKAFFGHVPIPLIHIDTSYKIPDVILSEPVWAAVEILTMIYGQNRQALDEERDLPGRCHRSDRLLQGAQDLNAEAHAQRRVDALPAQPLHPEIRGATGTPSRSPASSWAPAPTQGGSGSKERYFLPRNKQSEAWTWTSRPSSGTSSRPSSRPAPTCGSIRCWTGPSSTSGSTSRR